MPRPILAPLASLARPALFPALVMALSLALSACAEQTFEGSVSRTDLEGEVADLFPSGNPSIPLAVACEGGIDSTVDATQTCRIARVDDDTRDSFVLVRVAAVVDDQTRISARPFVPADRVAGVILRSLVADGYLVDQVTCERELDGEVDASVDCTATPATKGNDGAIVATVTRVAGLKVAFDYEVSAS
ncbi:hypothetical protein GCM10027020_29140 [Nocardioides salsibiostraticola]